MSIENYKKAYESILRIRTEFSTKDGYIRKKGEDELSYHKAKKVFGQFRPNDKKHMEANTNHGTGTDVKLKNGETVHIDNQMQLYKKIADYNKKRGKFYDLKHIEKNNPYDLERLQVVNQNFDSAKRKLDEAYPGKLERFQIALKLEEVVETKLKKEKYNQQIKNDIDKANKEISDNNKVNVGSKKETKINNKSTIKVLKSDEEKKHKSITDELSNQFLIAGNSEKAKYYYKNKPDIKAFEDNGKKMVTESSSKQVAASMVELANIKNWETLKVKGNEQFKSEVWLQASLKGIAVKGYKPNDKDYALLKEIQTQNEKNSIEAEKIKENEKENFKITSKPNPQQKVFKKISADKNVLEMRDKILKSEKEQKNKLSDNYRDAYLKLNKKDALSKHPELKRVYDLEKAARQFINHPDSLIKLNKDDKIKFVESVRDKGINVIANGDKLPSLKTVKITNKNKSIERER